MLSVRHQRRGLHDPDHSVNIEVMRVFSMTSIDLTTSILEKTRRHFALRHQMTQSFFIINSYRDLLELTCAEAALSKRRTSSKVSASPCATPKF